MRWLLVEMWAYLAIAFVLGMAAYRWVFGGGGGGLSAEDLSAEFASVRTRQAENESERRRLRARIAELTAQLDDIRREARSAEAEAHAARSELSEVKAAADAAARAVARRRTPGLPTLVPTLFDSESAEPAPEVEGAPEGAPGMETVSFMAALREGAPDDLTKIKGIGQKLESALNALGVYYYRQIAEWSDAEIAEMDAKLKFPGRIERDKWRLQARRLLGREDPPPAPNDPPVGSGIE